MCGFVVMGAGVAIAVGVELRNIGTRDKGFFASALHDNQAHLGVVNQGLHGHRQGAPHVVVHGIEFGGIVEAHITHMAFDMVVQSACSFRGVAHGQITFFTLNCAMDSGE